MQSDKRKERRKHPRKSCCMAVDGFARGSGFAAIAWNISLGGAFIETPYRFTPDEEIFLLFIPRPYQQDPIKVASNIVWNGQGGFGVAFQDTPDRLATMIESFA